jgi:hypothetical protein
MNCVCMYACMYVHVRMHACMYVRTYEHHWLLLISNVLALVCMYACVCECMYVGKSTMYSGMMNQCIYIYIHTYIYTYIYIYKYS